MNSSQALVVQQVAIEEVILALTGGGGPILQVMVAGLGSDHRNVSSGAHSFHPHPHVGGVGLCVMLLHCPMWKSKWGEG